MERKIFGGYEMTPEIREEIKRQPDEKIALNNTTYSILYGEQVIKGHPKYSAYCIIEKNGINIGEIIAGSVTREDSKKALGTTVYRLIKIAEGERKEDK